MNRKLAAHVCLTLLFLTTFGAAGGGPLGEKPAPKSGNAHFIVYYFHGKFRCPTCLKIERLSGQAVRDAYADYLERGGMEWRPVDVDRPENRHFSKDFDLETSTLVVARVEGGRMRTFRKLEKVWDLVDEDERKFVTYVWDEIDRFVGE